LSLRAGLVADKLSRVIVDVWMQHPTLRFLGHEMFASLRRWTGRELPHEELPIDLTAATMDQAGIG
jgi:uncharacterized protein